MSFDIDFSQVTHLRVDLAGAPEQVRARAPRAVSKTLAGIEGDAKILAPVDVGNLQNSISSDIDADGMGGEVGPTVDYGAHVEYGTDPHIIRAHGGGVLAFPGAGGMVFTKEVHHPGTRPQPYMGPAFERRAPGFLDALGDIGEGIL